MIFKKLKRIFNEFVHGFDECYGEQKKLGYTIEGCCCGVAGDEHKMYGCLKCPHFLDTDLKPRKVPLITGWQSMKYYNRRDYGWVLLKCYVNERRTIDVVGFLAHDGNWYDWQNAVINHVPFMFFDIEELCISAEE